MPGFRIPRSRHSAIATALLAVFASLGGRLGAQSQPSDKTPAGVQNQASFQLKVASNLVVVRVVVRDAQGKPVEGLQKEDFKLFDRGKEQSIAQFEAEVSAPEAPVSVPTTTPNQPATPPAKAPVAPQRFLALYFDDMDMAAADVSDARAAVDHYLATSLQPSERVAAFTSSAMLSDFTADPKQIRDALLRLHPNPQGIRQTDCLQISDYQALEITEHDDPDSSDAWRVAIDQAINSCHMQNPKNPPVACNESCIRALEDLLYGRIRNQAQRIQDQSQMQARTSLQALDHVVNIVSHAPGQRNIILVSPGFLSHGEQYQLDRIIDRALRSEVVISSLDPRGLALLMRESDVTSGYTPSASSGVIGAQHSVDTTREFVAAGVLAEVAEGTGGEFFHNNNDLAAGFRALADSQGFYILAFAPAGIKQDGKFHALKVKLTEKHRGFTLQGRRGYFASKNEAEAVAKARGTAAPEAETQAQEQIREAILSKTVMQQLPVGLSAKLTDVQGEKRELALFAHLDARSLHFHKEGEHNLNTVTFVFAVFDEKENLVDSEQRRARVNILDAQLPELLKTGMDVEMTFQLKPATYRVREVVTDSEDRSMTAFSENVTIPVGGAMIEVQREAESSSEKAAGSMVARGPESLPLENLFDLWSMGNTERSPLQDPGVSVSKLDSKVPNKARREYAKGYLLLTQKDFKGALKHLATAASLDSEFVAAHNALGWAYLKMGQNSLARDQFAKAVSLDDHLPGSFLNLGCAQLALKDYRAAEESVQKASSIAPLDLQLATALAYVQLMNQDYGAAVATVHQVHSEKHEGASMAHYYAAAAWQAQTDLPKTRDELETLLREDPLSPVAEQARQVLGQIKTALSQPDPISVEEKKKEPPAIAGASAVESSNAGPTAEEVAAQRQLATQEAKEEKQIAQAEAADATCATCSAPGSPGGAALAARYGPNPRAESAPAVTADPFSLRSTVDEVAVLFAATDHGKPVTDLTREEVEILDNRKPPVAITGFRNEAELPLRLGVIIDTSQSVTGRFSFEQRAAIQFLQKALINRDDQAFVVGVANSVLLVQDFTGDQRRISHAIDQLAPAGGTALWDAVAFASHKIANWPAKEPVARALVVISDGKDNSSRTTLEAAIEAAQKGEVFVCTVSVPGVNNGNEPPATGDLVGDQAMKVLAEHTGGAAFVPNSLRDLDHDLDEVQQVLRSRYLISYKPALFKSDGQYRAIDISARKLGHKLRVYAEGLVIFDLVFDHREHSLWIARKTTA